VIFGIVGFENPGSLPAAPASLGKQLKDAGINPGLYPLADTFPQVAF